MPWAVESLSETELVNAAIEERLERTKSERMNLQPINENEPWTDWLNRWHD